MSFVLNFVFLTGAGPWGEQHGSLMCVFIVTHVNQRFFLIDFSESSLSVELCLFLNFVHIVQGF